MLVHNLNSTSNRHLITNVILTSDHRHFLDIDIWLKICLHVHLTLYRNLLDVLWRLLSDKKINVSRHCCPTCNKVNRETKTTVRRWGTPMAQDEIYIHTTSPGKKPIKVLIRIVFSSLFPIFPQIFTVIFLRGGADLSRRARGTCPLWPCKWPWTLSLV